MAQAAQVFGNTEILNVAEAVARDKGVPRDVVIDALKQAIQTAGRKKYGLDKRIIADLSAKTGQITLYRERDVVEQIDEELENEQILADDPLVKEHGLELGGILREELPPIDVGRVAAQTAKGVILQKVRDAEREKQFEQFKDKEGEIIHGVVKAVDRNNLTIEVNGVEAIIRRDELLPRENYRAGDRVKAICLSVERKERGTQVLLSRAHGDFLAKLFMQEVPEIYDGVIEIVSVARDPGSRAKVSVYSNDSSIDPKASCIGVRGSRVQAVVSELQGEKIDIINYDENPAAYVVAALTPAEASKIVVDEDANRIEVVVNEDNQALAIGRRGQNVKLASELIGWDIEILGEGEEQERRATEYNNTLELFTKSLNVEEIIAQLLVAEGFATVEEIAYVPFEELAAVEGFDEDLAEEIRNRAVQYLEAQLAELEEKLDKLGVAEDMYTLPGIEEETIDPQVILKLAENKIVTRDDLGDLSTDEFIELVPNSGMNEDEINNLIMTCRAAWFDESGETKE